MAFEVSLSQAFSKASACSEMLIGKIVPAKNNLSWKLFEK
jgi:hypothetical protein